MKLIDYICLRTADTEEYITSLACPSSFGLEYDKYGIDCGKFETCRECWEQEMKPEVCHFLNVAFPKVDPFKESTPP